MGFNLLVKLVVRAGSFAFGAFGTAIIVGVINDVYAWFWLPILLGLAVSLVVTFQPWFQATRLSLPFCASLTSGTALTYCLSTPAGHSSISLLLPKFAIGGQLLVFICVFGWFLAGGLSQRKTAAMSLWLTIPILAGCVLGYVSGGIGGSSHMLEWVIQTLHLSKGQAEIVIFYFRKTVHFTAYGTVGLALFRGAIAGAATKKGAIAFALLVVLCISSFDEIRQTTASNRTGTPVDVALDLSGTSVFVLVAAVLVRSPRRPAKK